MVPNNLRNPVHRSLFVTLYNVRSFKANIIHCGSLIWTKYYVTKVH